MLEPLESCRFDALQTRLEKLEADGQSWKKDKDLLKTENEELLSALKVVSKELEHFRTQEKMSKLQQN